MDDLERWLATLGLEGLASVLRANDVDLELLPELTEADLAKLDLSLGERKKLLKAAASLLQPASSLAASGAAPASSSSAAASAERRHLTVMFYDLVGSTALAARYDPEDVREAIGTFHRCVGKAIVRFGGFVARTLGDGALVYFGYPQAHEDDAERAVRAGLVAVEAIAGLTLPNGQAPQIRVGIATGVVVVGDIIGTSKLPEADVVGETPNLAARLQAIAEPSGVVISASTRQLVGNLFECRDVGPVEVKGFAEPVQAWQVLRESGAESRFEALHAAELTPLVGREAEIELLLDRWQRAKHHGEGQVVLISGEPGIGKSRLIADVVRERLQVEPSHTRLRYFCSPYHTDSALYPIVAQLERAAGFAREDDTPETKLDKLEALLAETSPPAEDMQLLAELLSIPTTDRYPPLNLTPRRKKERTLEALLRQLAALARDSPLLVVFEDVHWIDPSSRELLELAVDRVARLSALLLITFRPDFQPPLWSDQAHVTTLALRRLDRREGEALVERIARHKTLPGEIVDQIVAKTDGVPLFVEELTKTVLESGLLEDRGDRYALVGLLSPLAIPATLQDSLMARLDRVSPVKEVAQIAAAIGREFSHGLLAAVAPPCGSELRDALDQLVRAGLVFRRDVPERDEQTVYTFKHALVQDAAYQTLLRSTRQQLHARIARVLEERFPETSETEPEFLAHHCAQAGLIGKAIDYWRRASQHAVERAANVEAVAHLDRALQLLNALPETPERDQQELMLLISRGPPLTATRSYASPELGDNYGRALKLCRRIGNAPHIFQVLQGLYRFYLVRAELQTALETTKQLLEIASNAHDRGLLMEANQAHMFSLGFRGELDAAQRHFEECMALFDPDRFRSRIHLYSTDTATSVLCLGSLVAWLQGFPDRAATTLERALTRAREVDHAYTLAWALNFAAVIRQIRGEVAATRGVAEECVAHAQRHEFPFWLAGGRIMRGWSMVAEGEQPEDGIAEMRDGLAGWKATGAVVFSPYYLSCLIEGYRIVRRPGEGLCSLTEMISAVQRTGERWWEPELHRLKGELMRAADRYAEGVSEPEACFMHAIELANRQEARSLGLRAKMSLSRLWHDRGRRREARDLLATSLSSFTEGFDTADLRAARQLLDRLA